MNEEQQITWLRRLRENLRQGDMEQLASNAEKMGLDALLDPAFLSLARQHSAYQVVILIATLGQANTDNTNHYSRLLSAFQFVTGQIDIKTASEICSKASNSPAQYYMDLFQSVNNKKYETNFDTITSFADDIEFGIYFLIDNRCSHNALKLMKSWQKIDKSNKPWLTTCKAIALRAKEVALKSEAKDLAMATEGIIKSAPKSLPKITQQMKTQWANLALKSQDPEISLIASQIALKGDNGLSQHMNLAKSLILNKSYQLAAEQLRKMIEIATDTDCKKHTPKNFQSKKFDINEANDTLLTVNKILKSKGLKPFLMSGTLLGYKREGSILSHDKDIDLGIIGWENQYTIAEALIEAGFYKIDLSQLTGKNRFLISANDLRNGMAIDFFIFHEYSDHFLHGIDFDIGMTQNYRFSLFELQEVEFLNEKFFTPSDIEKNLSENYGDWQTPISSYVVTVESPAIIPIKNGESLITYMEIFKTIYKDLGSKRLKRIIDHVQQQNSFYIPNTLMHKLNQWMQK